MFGGNFVDFSSRTLEIPIPEKINLPPPHDQSLSAVPTTSNVVAEEKIVVQPHSTIGFNKKLKDIAIGSSTSGSALGNQINKHLIYENDIKDKSLSYDSKINQL